MLFSWLRRRRRRRLLAEPFPADWDAHLSVLPFVATLDGEERQRLRDDLRVFAAERWWEGCGGLEVDDRMRVVIAAQACLLTLNLGLEYYQRVRTILVYPAPYRARGRGVRGGVVTEGVQGRAGEAMLRGPVVLAWSEALAGGRDPDDGRNLVLHEFAHQLDFLDDYADATPPLADAELRTRWRRVFEARYEELSRAARRGRVTLLDHYGATNPAEFFAVATECFFERPRRLRDRHPELYGLLATFYRQDPARRLEGPA